MAVGRVVLGLGLLLVALGLFLLPPGEPAPAAASGPAPVSAGATDPMDISANNSPALAADPTTPERMALVHRVDLPRYGCGIHLSTDGGVTWTPTTVPMPPDVAPVCFAPDVVFAADGTLHVLYVTLVGIGNAPGGVWLVSSDDHGQSWSAPTAVAGARSFHVRLAADPEDAQRLYVTWLAAGNTALFAFPEPGYPLVVSTSDDAGRSWSDPAVITPPERLRPIAPAPAVGDDGTLHVAYLDLRDDRLDYHGGHEGFGGVPYPGPWELVVARSTDQGRTWSETTVDADLVPTQRFLIFLPPFPSLAVHGDRLHVGFHDARAGDPDVWLWTSTDGGDGWSAPTRVNDTGGADGTAQHLPQVDVAPDGRIDVVYLDRRDDPADVLAHVSHQSSFDGGATFGPSIRLTDAPFDTRIGPGSERDLTDLGTRIALRSGSERLVAAWVDTGRGTIESAKQDIVRAVATPGDPGGRGVPRIVAVTVAVAGLAVLVTAGLGRPRGRARAG